MRLNGWEILLTHKVVNFNVLQLCTLLSWSHSRPWRWEDEGVERKDRDYKLGLTAGHLVAPKHFGQVRSYVY